MIDLNRLGHLVDAMPYRGRLETPVRLIGICALLDAMKADGLITDETPYLATGAIMMPILEAQGAHYHAEEKTPCIDTHAVEEALKLGKHIVVVEDLS